MALEIVHYPHPALRHKSKPLRRVDDELRRMIREMFGLMYAAKGIGLAANQVALPYRFFIANLSDKPGSAADECVFLNPVLSKTKGLEEAEEGCLSLPGLYQKVVRPAQVRINAYNLKGEEITWDLDDLFARVVQHEVDHLDGVLFIDRLDEERQFAAREKVREFERAYEARRAAGESPTAEQIAARLKELEQART